MVKKALKLGSDQLVRGQDDKLTLSWISPVLVDRITDFIVAVRLVSHRIRFKETARTWGGFFIGLKFFVKVPMLYASPELERVFVGVIPGFFTSYRQKGCFHGCE